MVNSEVSNQLTTNNRPTRIAILDLGTNTFHLLIADIKEEGKPLIVCKETIAVKLGEGGISEGTISREAFERGIKAIATFKERIDQYQVTEVKSAATSAIRSASNGADFIEKIKSETGLDLEIIDGDREAELIYHGVRAAVNLENASLVVDIGGGSVEFIICDKNQIFWKKSYPIGAARMMARFHHTDPILEAEVAQLNTYLDNTLKDLRNQVERYQPDLMIGSAGAFETFAALQGPQFTASFQNPETLIDLERFSNISKMIIESTHAERERMPEIPPVRVDMIVVSTILTNYILSSSGIKRLKLSSYSLKEGVLFEMLK
jgi:exopolyphosphatase/guanosine-5'-triphosphate,3'-diphosphate pyrophosphatase